MTTRLLDKLLRPVSPASLGLFRICLGVVMAWHLVRYMPYVTETLVHSKFFLTYDGLHWIRILPAPAMTALFYILIGASVLLTLGMLCRPAALVLWLGWTYVLLLDRGHYNNHSYLLSLLCFLMIFVSADRWPVLTNGRRGSRKASPIPFWQIGVLRAQLFLVYLHAGLAKLGADWLAGYPMTIWLRTKADVPLIGGLLTTDAAPYVFSYGALFFDLGVGFALLSRRTRAWALVPLIGFHLANAMIWNIGVFPWLMLAATSLFFDPDWPERALARATGARMPPPIAATADTNPHDPGRAHLAIIAVMGVFVAWQALFPLRHLLHPAPPEWYGRSNLFAWRMLTVDRVDAVRIRVEVPGAGTVGYVSLEEYVNRTQLERMSRMPTSFLRFVHFLRAEMSANAGIDDARIFVDVKRQLNERPFQQLIDPGRDLTKVPYRSFGDADYVLPLDPSIPVGSADAISESPR